MQARAAGVMSHFPVSGSVQYLFEGGHVLFVSSTVVCKRRTVARVAGALKNLVLARFRVPC